MNASMTESTLDSARWMPLQLLRRTQAPERRLWAAHNKPGEVGLTIHVII